MKIRITFFLLCFALAVSQLVGCGTSEQMTEELAALDAELVMVDSAAIDALATDELFIVDMTADHLVYAIDLLEVDPSRIEVRGTDKPAALLADMIAEQADVQGYAGDELERIVLTARSENFGTLAPWEVDILDDEGYYSTETELMQGADEALGSIEGAIKVEIYFTAWGVKVCIKIRWKKAKAFDTAGKAKAEPADMNADDSDDDSASDFSSAKSKKSKKSKK